MRSSDWSSDVCSSDLADLLGDGIPHVDVEADVLVTLLELEGNEGGIRRDDEVGGAAGLAGGRHGRQREGCKNEFNEFHGCFPCSGTGAPLSWRPITRKSTWLLKPCRHENLRDLVRAGHATDATAASWARSEEGGVGKE